MSRIVIDGRMWRNTGIGTYLRNLVYELDRQSLPHEIVLILRSEDSDSVHLKNLKVEKDDTKLYSVAEQIVLFRKLKRLKPDLVHFPHFNVPIFYNRPFVVTFHDLITLKYRVPHKNPLKNIFTVMKYLMQKPVMASAIKKAKRILVPTEWVKNDLARTFPASSGKTRVTYEGTGQVYEGDSLLEGINKPYALYVGMITPHKNISGLIQAWEKISKISDCHLVVVGKGVERASLEEKARELKLPVTFTGYLSDAELGGLYRNASIFVFPSFEEGFGLTPLEAMQYGVPVAASNASCIPEVLGEAALYFDPNDPADIAAKILSLLEDHDLQQSLTLKGSTQVKKYSWAKMAQETLDTYEESLR